MWTIIKASKGVALVAFLLPWVTVSCSNQSILRATGVNLVTGNLAITNPITGARQVHDGGGNGLLLLAVIAIVIGLVAALKATRQAAMVSGACSAIALLAIWVGTRGLSNEALADKMAREGGGRFDATAAAMIRVDWQVGYWVINAALIVALVVSWLTFSGKRLSVSEGPSS